MTTRMSALTFDRTLDALSSSRGLWKREVDRPVLDPSRDPGDAERVLVKVDFAGFCGSDRSIWNRRAFGDMIDASLRAEGRSTRIVGHELLGSVLELGSRAAEQTTARVGDVVTTESHLICGACYQCKRGETHVCADDRIIGISADGVFAEYAKLPAKTLWPVDTLKIRPEVAAIQEPFGNAVHCAQQIDLGGSTIAIFGCGTIGLFLIPIARALGAKKIICVEPFARNAELARRLGADHVIVPGGGDEVRHDAGLAESVRSLTGGVGVDASFEMAGPNSSVNNAIAAARRGGHVILFGIKSADFVVERFDRLVVNGITLHGVVGRRIFETWEITRRLLEDRSNGIQKAVWNIILEEGHGPVVDFHTFDRERFEQSLQAHTKVVLKF